MKDLTRLALLVVTAVALIATSRVPTVCTPETATFSTETNCEAPGELQVALNADCSVSATSPGGGLPPSGSSYNGLANGFALADGPVDGGTRTCAATNVGHGSFEVICTGMLGIVSCSGLVLASDADAGTAPRTIVCSDFERRPFVAETTCGPTVELTVWSDPSTCSLSLSDPLHLYPAQGAYFWSTNDVRDGFFAIDDATGRRCHATRGAGSMAFFCSDPCPDAGDAGLECRTVCGGTLTEAQ